MDVNVDDEDVCDYYALTSEDFNSTCISSWYQNPSLRSLTSDTLMFQLPPRVIKYLQDGSVRLPTGIETSGTDAAANALRTESSCSRNDEWSDEDGDESEEEPGTEKFVELDNWSTTSIALLGGSAFPKVSWKCPKDATWVGFNKSLKCYSPGDIYLLLKCSSNVADVLDRTLLAGCPDMSSMHLPIPTLILRRWTEISPAAEFRCFVLQHQLTAISQRDVSASYPSILTERDNIIQDIHHMYRKIARWINLTHYTFDVARMGSNQVLLIDLNVFGLPTDPCLFSYKELKNIFDGINNVHTSANGNGIHHTSGPGTTEVQGFGNTIFKFIDNDKMLKFRREVNALPSIV